MLLLPSTGACDERSPSPAPPVLTTAIACVGLDGLQGAEGDDGGGDLPKDAMADRTAV
ncbi:MAG: hypothetical protein U0169_04895 [Polyangiaceae bacterium]